jgi:hypothetical protein
MLAARSGFERLCEGGIFQPEIQEARAGDFHFFANIRNIELRQHIGGELARIHFPGLGERHERIALVIAKFRVGTWADQNGGNGIRLHFISARQVRQNGADGGLQLQLDLFVWKHGKYLTTDGHGLYI